MLRILFLIALGWILNVPQVTKGQSVEGYPSRPVRLVAAAAPGGNPDILARVLGQKLTDALGKPFVVENVPGAGGVVAAKMIAAAPPDGHLLLLGDSGAMAINLALDPTLPYHPLRDFTAITALATVPTVLVVHPSVPAKTLAEFVELARSKPGQLNYGSAGPGSIHHLTMAIFADRAGIELQHVPYRGGSALVNGLLTGEIQAGWSGIPNVLPLIQSGSLRVFCISTIARSKSMPDLPTCAELGYAGFDVASMIGLQTSAGAPREVITLIQSAIAKALRDPEITERMKVLGMEMQENGTQHYTQFMKDDIERYEKAVKQLGIQIK
jgi:tripartite-type tricarboxylate transporter receptor subunit TctC